MVDVGPLVNGVKQGIVSRGFQFDTAVCDPDALLGHEPSDSAVDLGVVLLSSALSLADLPELPQVYTLGDFMDRMNNMPSDPTFFTGPVSAIGWAGNPQKNLATVTNLVFDRRKIFGLGVLCLGGLLCSNDAAGWWIHDNIDAAVTANRLELQHGDSGGPIVFREDAANPTIFGVFSLFSPDVVVFNSWSPTWDNGQGNGAFSAAVSGRFGR